MTMSSTINIARPRHIFASHALSHLYSEFELEFQFLSPLATLLFINRTSAPIANDLKEKKLLRVMPFLSTQATAKK